MSEHIFADSRIIIREDEPTSIIAFTLASRPYRDKLRNLAHQSRTLGKQEAQANEVPAVDMTGATDPPFDETCDPDDGRRERGTHLNYGW